jgi:hypothetical protein
MDLQILLLKAKEIFDSAHARYGLIGAFGMSVHGFQRATNDIDFLVGGDQKAAVETAFLQSGFSVFHKTDEVLQLSSDYGQIDIIYANRPISKEMLLQTDLQEILGVPCLRAEDIIGLKIQAVANDGKRKLREFADIQSLIEANSDLDWDRIKKYADLFDCWQEVVQIRHLVGK